MRKAFKIILAIFAVLIILLVAFGAVFSLGRRRIHCHWLSNPDASQEPPWETPLVVYDPGLSGAAKGVADKVAS